MLIVVFFTLLTVRVILAIALDTVTLEYALWQRSERHAAVAMLSKQRQLYFKSDDSSQNRSWFVSGIPGPSDDVRDIGGRLDADSTDDEWPADIYLYSYDYDN